MLNEELEQAFKYDQKLRDALIEEEALRHMSENERRTYLADKQAAVNGFAEAIGHSLDSNGVPTTKAGFDRTWDRIGEQAPSPEAAVEGQRTLGRRWSLRRKALKHTI